MRHLTYIIALTMGTILLNTSCKFEDDDNFDESASLRIEHFNDNVQQVLTAAPYGWNIQYFCGTNGGQYEGFNLYASFSNDGSVLMASDHRMLRNGNKGQYTESRSLYSILEEDGPVLAFNTWNDVLTVFSDPVSPTEAPDKQVNDGQGMAGDYNFIVESCTEDEIILIGQRYRARVRMVRCECPWQEHIASVKKTKADITNNTITAYYLTNGADTMYFSTVSTGVITYTERLVNPLTVSQMACVFTPDGIHIERAHSLGKNTYQDFHVNADSTMLTTLDGSVQCIPMWDSYVASHKEQWTIDQSTLSDEQKAYIETIDAGLNAFNNKYSLAKISLGKTSSGTPVVGLVLTYYTATNKKKTSDCALAINTIRTAFGEVAMSLDENPQLDTNLTNILKSDKTPDSFREAVMALAESLCGTYSVTPDNYFLPTGATFINSEKTFICSKQ